MSKDRDYQRREGRHVATRQDLQERLRPGIFRIFTRRGRTPEKGSGRYSIENARAAIAVERRNTRRGVR